MYAYEKPKQKRLHKNTVQKKLKRDFIVPNQKDIPNAIKTNNKSSLKNPADVSVQRTMQFSGRSDVIQLLTDSFIYDDRIRQLIIQYNITPNIQHLTDILELYRTFLYPKKLLHRSIINEVKGELPAYMANIGPANGYYDQEMADENGEMINGVNSHTQARFQTIINADIGNLAVNSPTALRLFELLHARRQLPAQLEVAISPSQTRGNAVMSQTGANASVNAGGNAGPGESVAVAIDSTSTLFGGNPRNIVLIHELIHSLHATYGVKLTNDNTINPQHVPPMTAGTFITTYNNFYNGALPDDIATMGNLAGGPNVEALMQAFYFTHAALNLHLITENRIRAELGIPARTRY